MDATDTVARLTPYLRRLLEDEHLQDEIRELIADARRGAARARRVGPERAIGDKRLHRHVAAGLAAAGEIFRVARPPEPSKPRRRWRVAGLALVGAGAALAYRRLTAGRSADAV